jgi:hypothetical protein
MRDAKIETTGEEGASPIVDAHAVLIGVILLVIVKQSGDWYSAIDES